MQIQKEFGRIHRKRSPVNLSTTSIVLPTTINSRIRLIDTHKTRVFDPDPERAKFGKMNRKPGDWNCSSCQHLNFSRRDSCQKCGDPRPGGSRGDERSEYGSFSRGGGGGNYGYGGGGSYGGGSDVRPGDWYCSAGGCGAHNFASRSSCFKCGSGKEESGRGSGFESSGGRGGSRGGFGFGSSYNSGSGGRSGWKSGDWICGRSGCNEHNFASRMECFRCSAPRESGVEQ